MSEDQPEYERQSQPDEQTQPEPENRVIYVSMRNINVSGKSSKDGMVYKLNAEILEEDFDVFRSMSLVGLSAEAALEITHVNTELFSDAQTEEREKEHEQKAQAEEDDPYRKKPIGVLCKEITRDYCPAPKFQRFCADVIWADKTKVSAHYAGEAVKRWIGFKSRKSVDYDDKAKAAWLKMVEVYHSWLKDQKTKKSGRK